MTTPKLVSKIIIDGINGVGKTTIAKKLSTYFCSKVYAPFSGRDDIFKLWFSDPGLAKKLSIELLRELPSVGIFDRYHLTPQVMVNSPLEFVNFISDKDLIVTLDAEVDTIRKRLSMRNEPEEIDANGFCRPHMNRLSNNWNAMYIKTDTISEDEIVFMIIDRYNELINGEKFKIRDGKSKTIYRHGNKIIVKLKPSLDSYTYGRSKTINGTEILRNAFIEKFVATLKNDSIEVMDYTKMSPDSYATDYSFSMPFEVIVKSKAVGTTIIDCPGLFYLNMPFAKPIVRFDYRRTPKDLTIPNDYILNYGIDPLFLESNSVKAFESLRKMLFNKGYELVDLCFVYGFSLNGAVKIISEISPDGMRIRKDGKSYDKDLFREGFADKHILESWSKLLSDLT